MIKCYNLQDLTVNLFLITSCNLGCEWCIARDYMSECRKPKFIQEDAILELEKRMRKGPPKQINLLGGEPTLHPKVLEIGRRLYACGTLIGLSTNGLWNERFRKEFERIEYPIETEITFLGWHHYNLHQKKELIDTFEQLKQKGNITSIGAIIDSENFSGTEHLDIAEKYNFELRWSFSEPVASSVKLFGYKNRDTLREYGERIYEIIKEANKRGIETWGDICVPLCAFSESQLEIFVKQENDVSFICPPFFDISPDLTTWRCLLLRQYKIGDLKEYETFLEAYNALNNYECKNNSGIFDMCKSCGYLNSVCGGGPRIVKDFKQS